MPEAQIKAAGCPWAAVCTNLGHKSKLKISVLFVFFYALASVPLPVSESAAFCVPFPLVP